MIVLPRPIQMKRTRAVCERFDDWFYSSGFTGLNDSNLLTYIITSALLDDLVMDIGIQMVDDP